MGVSYISLLLALLAWRLAETKRFPAYIPREKLFLIVYVLSAFTMAIFCYTRIRYRLPYDYLIITVIAMHLSRRLQLWLERQTSAYETHLSSRITPMRLLRRWAGSESAVSSSSRLCFT